MPSSCINKIHIFHFFIYKKSKNNFLWTLRFCINGPRAKSDLLPTLSKKSTFNYYRKTMLVKRRNETLSIIGTTWIADICKWYRPTFVLNIVPILQWNVHPILVFNVVSTSASLPRQKNQCSTNVNDKSKLDPMLIQYWISIQIQCWIPMLVQHWNPMY